MTLLSILLEALARRDGVLRQTVSRPKRRNARTATRGAVARILLLASLLVLMPACGWSVYSVPRPVDIDARTDVCARCRMSIDGLAHAAEIVTAEGEVRKFDSLGCLLEDFRELTAAGRRPGGVWVIDYNSKTWLNAQNAHYALANLPTDHMGAGVAATATRDAALKLANGEAAKVLNWEMLLHRQGKAQAFPEAQ